MSKLIKSLSFLGLVLAGTFTANAQIKFSTVNPSLTQQGIKEVHSGHLLTEPAKGTSKNLLIVMIPGTGGTAIHFRELDSSFAALGYHVLCLDYVNQVITTACSKSTDSTCFDNFRREIFFGTQVSDKVEVDSTNSILNRITQALVYLSKHDKEGGWGNFVKNGKPRWDRIIAAGHSQGAGHAGYMGQHFAVKGVMMLSGPQDYLQEFNAPAGWQYEKGITPAGKVYAFLHTQDPFVFQYQLSDVQAIRRSATPDTLMVQPGVPVTGNRHVMVTDIETKDPHGSTLGARFANVRAYMLKSISQK
jgi:hypothetical protein